MILIGEGIVVKFIEKEGLRVEFICWIIFRFICLIFFFLLCFVLLVGVVFIIGKCIEII